MRQMPENVCDANAHPANTRPPVALARLDCDAFQKFHGRRIEYFSAAGATSLQNRGVWIRAREVLFAIDILGRLARPE